MEIKNTEDQFAEFEKYDVLSDQDIFTKIWTEPKRIFTFINEAKYEKYLYVIMFLAGISSAFDRASSKNMGENSSLVSIVLICIIMGGLLGWISYYIYAALLSWTGKWLNGSGDTSSIFRIIVYATIPSVVSLVFLIPQIAVYGGNLFKDIDYASEGILVNVVFWTSAFCEFSLSIVTLIFTVIGLSVVQKFSIGKAILNLILPILIIVVPILLLIIVFSR
ncbi:MAG: Yip1 family protein [Candidatus Chryseobacterium colombiense]|nr:Yip1 family protein [Chryseobacterium sp.]WEK68145.1 MAG: Yip1 family protein [Chryseobacterium sp.]